MLKQTTGWANTFRQKLGTEESPRCLDRQDLGELLGQRDLVEAVGHVEIDKYLEACSLGQFMMNDRDGLLRNLDVLVDLTIIATKPDERLSGFGSDDQRGGYWRFTLDIEILVESIELFLGICIECFSDRPGLRGNSLGQFAKCLQLHRFNLLETVPLRRCKGFNRGRALKQLFDFGALLHHELGDMLVN